MSQSKKQSFLHGTVLLAMATAIVKVVGAFYKIPLNAIIGEQGFSYFNTAYEIYGVLTTISVAGLPLAMSRMISEASALGHHNQVRRIYNTARALFLSMGAAGSLLMTLFCRELAQFQEQPDAWAAIACLGPCMFLICVMAAYRGFFQGQSNMLPTATSQVLESICKLIVGIVAAITILKLTDSIPLAAGGAILGVTASCLLSVCYLSSCFRKSKRALPESSDPVDSYWRTAKDLLAIAIPVTIGSAGLSVLSVLETKIYMGQLLATGNTQLQADTMKGIYDMTKTIFNMPSAFIPTITISIIPAITAQLTLKDYHAARSIEESAIRITGLICAPCTIGLVVMARPVTALLGGYGGDNLNLATVLMTILGSSILFSAMSVVTNSIMQSHGHPNLPVINMFIGGVLKLVAVYVLTSNPHIGILGAPIGALLGYAIIMLLNIFTLRRCVTEPPAILRNLGRSALAALIMGIFVALTRFGLERILGSSGHWLLLCAVPIVVGICVYFFAAIKLKAITRTDCLLLPKGEKIANLLHL